LKPKSNDKMAGYKIIKFCRMCRKKFIVNKGESKIIYCEDCDKKVKAGEFDNDDE